jgi:hypothetical protein
LQAVARFHDVVTVHLQQNAQAGTDVVVIFDYRDSSTRRVA